MATRTNEADGDMTVMPASHDQTPPIGADGGASGSGPSNDTDTSAGSDQSASSSPPASGDGNNPSASGGSNPPADSGGDGTTDSGGSSSSGGSSLLSGDTGGAPGMPTASLLDGGDSVLQPVTGLVSDAGIESGSGSLTSGIPGSLVSAVTSDLGDTGLTGVGTNGLPDLVNDVVNLPGSILNGALGDSLGHIGTDLSNTVASTVGAVDGLANTVLGSNDALAPVSNLVNGITGNLDHSLVSADGGTAGTAGLLDLGGNSGGNLIDAGAGQSDSGVGVGVLSTPDSDGHTAAVSALDLGPNGPQPISADIAPDGVNGAGVGDILNGNGLGDVSGLTANPLLTLNGGNNADDGGTAGATAGDLNGSSSGSVIHADIGQPDSNGTGVGVLASPSADHTADVNAIDTGPGGPQLVDAGLANDVGIPSLGDTSVPSLDGLAIPTLGSTDGLGSDASLLTVNGGNNAGDGGVVGGSLVNSNGSSSGNLIDADAGPSQNGDNVSVLTAPGAADHTVTAGAVDVGSNGPQLADAGVLTMPGLFDTSSGGLDSLVGNVLGGPTPVTETAAPATAPAATDIVDTSGLLPGSVTGDHGIVDVAGHHII
jgi:hypothetical protein